MNTTSRVKKVYHLRKTVTSAIKKDKPQEEKVEREEQAMSQFKQEAQDNQALDNNSFVRRNQIAVQENYTIEEQSTQRLVEGPELAVNTLFLSFEQKLDCIQTKEIKVKNVGSSAIYYQWKFKNEPRINNNAIKDLKPKFFCHYSKQSIKPGEQITFIFSFVSQIPGFFTEECELICEPALITPIPIIRLQGKAYIDDQWRQQRANFLKQLEDSIRECHVHETVDDLIDEVKLPQPERPNVKDLKVAQEIFEKVNENLKLYFNPYIHSWFNQLFEEVWRKQYQGTENEDNVYWDQSIQSFKSMISNSKRIDQVQKTCYLQRLQHYTHLSTFPLPNKSQLYQTVYNIVSNAAYHLGGDYADAVKKQLDMWQVPFRQPLDTDTQDDLKARKQEVEKIKAEWLKRTKKKKWGEEEEKLMVEDFKNKVRAKVTQEILGKFDGFQNEAEYTKIQKVLQKDTFDPSTYFLFLERMKTVNQYSFQGKKVFLKFNLKLKPNCQTQLKELSQYLVKKQQEKKRLEEEKKNHDAKKKKPAPKKKGQKEEQEQKPLTFDFSSILDQENWNGFLETFRSIQEKSPFLIVIGCTYRERLGRVEPQQTVAFLLDYLKTIQPSIQWMSHDDLYKAKENLENEVISEGSIFFVENLNFLPSQTLNCQQVEIYQEDGVEKQRKKKRNVIYPEIRDDLDRWTPIFDVIVDEDRFLAKSSGISSYSHVEVILGKTWWNYVAYAQRVQNQVVILSGDFNPQNYLLINRLLKYSRYIYLTGTLGLKFRIALKDLKQLGNVRLNDKEIALIKQIVAKYQTRLFVPEKFKFLLNAPQGEQRNLITKDISESETFQELSNAQFLDIAEQLGLHLSQNSVPGHIFMLGKSHPTQYDQEKYGQNSTVEILRSVFKLQQQKRTRHSIEGSTTAGIDYSKDIVFYLVGVDENYVETIELKQKKVKIGGKKTQDEDEDNQQQQDQQEEGEDEKKKIDLVADFKLSSQQTLVNLISGKFDYGLKNVSKYPKPRII